MKYDKTDLINDVRNTQKLKAFFNIRIIGLEAARLPAEKGYYDKKPKLIMTI